MLLIAMRPFTFCHLLALLISTFTVGAMAAPPNLVLIISDDHHWGDYVFIAQSHKDAKPFFVWYAPLMPHDPHTPPERILKKYRDKAPSEQVAKS